ncbi:TRAP transporter fused permease subunit [Paracoccus sp. 1_MG-2023]|uniref:TRAP transporter permease n=1 Tax=unclassified Paracoccus (in: a-proteobacteria) TaxID=2688777 RepID=UPI001C0867AE|nr:MULTISPECIES: TRAP transporter fused permease subunit [unclassified Paracoccus (in: a-proteobacteria)]MBU2958971.1 TRAP transporter fused permease subunit [Paracoccus sp. C2R09]MDO6670370.1 TRAP transporter fused permease subunit [Paracoccus sp. 1_MG-2023]
MRNEPVSTSATAKLLTAIAFLFGAYHLLVVSGLLSISTMEARLTHLALALTLIFARTPARPGLGGNTVARGIDIALIVAGLIASGWLLTRWKAIAFSGGITTPTDYYAGLVITALVFEAARRGVGAILASITMVFFLYPFVSPYLPGLLNSRGYGLDRVVSFLTTDTQGIYGIPIGVAATYIIVFTIFGALLSRLGAGDFFFEVSRRLTYGMRAAGAKSAVLFSALIGMVSGSAAGNVAVTGTMTIPLMTREGYKPHQAAAVEAVASTGGQIMPPVMGAAAFIMAEVVGVSYTQIMMAGLLPALLFFATALVVVHLRAVRSGIQPSADRTLDPRSMGRVLMDGTPFIVAFSLLIGMMLMGYSPFKASLWAMGAIIISTAVQSPRRIRELPRQIGGAIVDGANGVVTISAACAAAGIIAGVLGMTGLGSKIAILIDLGSGGSLFIALMLTMVVSIILGMGLPTTAAYLILATVVAPALVKMGVPVLTAHFFVFYFGCMSTITPPVALAAYVAGGIAGADINKTGWTAAAYAAPSFLLPFAFCFGSGLLLQGDVAANLAAILTGTLGVTAIAVAVVGALHGRLPAIARVAAAGAGGMLLFQNPFSAILGCGILATIFAYSRLRLRSSAH